MALIDSRGFPKGVRANGYTIGTFSIGSMEMMQAVIAVVEIEHAPVVLQTTPSTLEYAEPVVFAAMTRAMIGRASVSMAMRLGHGDRSGLCQQATSNDYTSLMIDGSRLPLDENVALACRVVEMVSRMFSRFCMETELGKLGGKEDDLEVKPGEDLYTDLGEAAHLVRETGIDSLAVAIGTAHGFYKGKSKLTSERLTQIQGAVGVPLVLCGPSDVPDEDVQHAISMGVCKVNSATEPQATYTRAVQDCLTHDATLYNPREYEGPVREAVTSLVRHRIKICAGRAGLIAPL